MNVTINGATQAGSDLRDGAAELAAELAADTRAKFPSMSQEAAEQAARITLGLMLAFPEADQARIAALQQLIHTTEAQAGAQWAKDFSEAYLKDLVVPAYDRAIETKANPVDAIILATGAAKKDARRMARDIEKMRAQEQTENDPVAQAEENSAEEAAYDDAA